MSELVADTIALTGRHMRHIKRVPDQLLGVTIMPIAMVLVFGYIFGSAMEVPGGGSYREYVMAGIFSITMMSAMSTTAPGVANDLNNGLVDRFRSLPMSRYAVLLGRTISDVLMTTVSCAIMAVVGLMIGWRVHNSVGETLLGFGLLMLLCFAMCWVGVLLGLVIRSPEAVQSMSGLLVMPFALTSAAFVPLDGLPRWLAVAAEWNPISAVVTACRDLWGNPSTVVSDAFPAQHPILASFVSLGVLLLIVIPLAARAYDRAASR